MKAGLSLSLHSCARPVGSLGAAFLRIFPNEYCSSFCTNLKFRSRHSSYQFYAIQPINHVTRIGSRESYLKCRAAVEPIRMPEGLSTASLSATNSSGTCL
ncbi:unnamed protein product [Lasius platythorax]|uniref:Secreted protein n=1 Tax=Lasius platythorax TaxID=488582 RepID=A0AAV2PB95_9HYME